MGSLETTLTKTVSVGYVGQAGLAWVFGRELELISKRPSSSPARSARLSSVRCTMSLRLSLPRLAAAAPRARRPSSIPDIAVNQRAPHVDLVGPSVLPPPSSPSFPPRSLSADVCVACRCVPPSDLIRYPISARSSTLSPRTHPGQGHHRRRAQARILPFPLAGHWHPHRPAHPRPLEPP